MLEYNTRYPENPITIDKIRLRNPKLDDLGDVIQDCSIMENCYLYDDKELLLQIIDEKTNFEFINPNQPDNCYYVLIREWNP